MQNELAGISQQQIDAAAEAAAEQKEDGWVISNTRSSVDPFLSSSFTNQ
jgi:peptidyl-dipeptidase Dcp